MSLKYNNYFSKKLEFLEVTKERPDIVKIISGTSPVDSITKVYEFNGSRIIHSRGHNTNHASISNGQGYGQVQEWEISYVIEQILKAENEEVTMHVGRSGVIHLRTEGNALIN